MSKHLSSILQEADEIINSRAGGENIKEASAAVKDEEVLELASFLQNGSTKQASEVREEWAMNVTEKIAHALAVTECLMNLDELVKTAQFEKEACAKGFTDEQIEAFIEKRASTPGRFKSVLKMLPWLGVAGAGGAGAVKGYQKGKEGGYNQALQDVNQAMQEYAG